MAVSAFRSATKRGGQFGSDEANIPSTPRSRRDSGRGSHRRSSSVTDFSPRYMSDCSSTYHRSYRKSRSSVCPSDSENDMEYIPVHRRHPQRNADSEDEKPLSRSIFASKVNHQSGGLRRTSSGQDFTQNESNLRLNTLIPYNDLRGDDTQDFAEEKTVKAVYAQMKSLRTAPPVGDPGSSDFLDALRSEIQRAVGEIRIELEESKRKNCKSPETSDEGRLLESQGTDVIQAVADMRKEYSMKFEQSEKRVQELWSQLAIEEQRCSELAKIVKELLTPLSSAPHSFTASNSANRKRSHKRRSSAERQVVSTSLENEAQKYFEECVSLSPSNYQGDSADSCGEIDQHSESTKDGSFKQICNGGENLLKELENVTEKGRTSIFQEETQSEAAIVGNDGVVLPWLCWEAEVAVCDTDTEKVDSNGHLSTKGGSNINSSLHNNSCTKLNVVKKPTFDSNGSIVVSPMLHSSSITKVDSGGRNDKLVFKKAPKISGTVLQASKSSDLLLFTIDDKLSQKDYDYPDIETLTLERIRYKSRVERGELVLCQGFLW